MVTPGKRGAQMLDFYVRASMGCSLLWHYCWKETIPRCSSVKHHLVCYPCITLEVGVTQK